MGRGRHLAVLAGLVGSVFLSGAQVSYFEESLPSTMNPLFARSMVDFRTHELMFDRLFYRDAITNDLMSRVVSKAERLDEGQSLKVVLKDGIKWHDGKPFGPDDVCFTIDSMLNEATPSPIAKAYREAVNSCKALPRENAALVTMSKVYHNPEERLGFSVLPGHAFNNNTAVNPDADFSSRPTGSGPMKGNKGQRAVKLTAYDNPHHRSRIREVSLTGGDDPFVQVRTLLNNGVKGIISVPPTLRPDVAASDDVALKSYDLRSWWFIAVNTNTGLLKNQAVRQALNLSLDRSELRKLTIGVDPKDANPPCEFISGPFTQSSAYYNRQVPIVERSDLGQVAELMTASGAKQVAGRWTINGEPIVLKIGINAALEVEAKDLLNQVANQFQAAGFDRRVEQISTDDWNRQVVTGNKTEFDLLIGKWSFGQVEDVNGLFYSRQGARGALNIFNYANKDVDSILDQFDAARTDTEAKDAYHDLHAYLAQDLPYLFLWKLDTKSAWRNEVRNNIITPYFYFTEFDGWKYEG